mmetsp:Transcript_35/g.82  ORF Transcript_35/g.82 Transcript_35/m.82 type:complete len:288 (+) Transcript_35:1597-2460(+)
MKLAHSRQATRWQGLAVGDLETPQIVLGVVVHDIHHVFAIFVTLFQSQYLVSPRIVSQFQSGRVHIHASILVVMDIARSTGAHGLIVCGCRNGTNLVLALTRRKAAACIDLWFGTSTIEIVLDRRRSGCDTIKHDLWLRRCIDAGTTRLSVPHETLGALAGVKLRGRRIVVSVNGIGGCGTDAGCGGCTVVNVLGAGIYWALETRPAPFSFGRMPWRGATALGRMHRWTRSLCGRRKRDLPRASISGASCQAGTSAIVGSIGIDTNRGRRTRVPHRMVFRKRTLIGI